MSNLRLKTPGNRGSRPTPAPAPQPGTCNPGYTQQLGTGMQGIQGITGYTGYGSCSGVYAVCGSTSNEPLDRIMTRIKTENRQAKVDSVLMNKVYVEKKLEDDEEYKSLFGSSQPIPELVPKRGLSSKIGGILNELNDIPSGLWWVFLLTLTVMTALVVVPAVIG